MARKPDDCGIGHCKEEHQQVEPIVLEVGVRAEDSSHKTRSQKVPANVANRC